MTKKLWLKSGKSWVNCSKEHGHGHQHTGNGLRLLAKK